MYVVTRRRSAIDPSTYSRILLDPNIFPNGIHIHIQVGDADAAESVAVQAIVEENEAETAADG